LTGYEGYSTFIVPEVPTIKKCYYPNIKAEGSRFASLEDDDILKIIDDKDVKATKNVIINTKKNELQSTN
jgi:hypothetical protein